MKPLDLHTQIRPQLRIEVRERFVKEEQLWRAHDGATDTLELHKAIQDADWPGVVLPTFRPDAVVNIDTPGWRQHVQALSEVSGIEVDGYRALVRALEDRLEEAGAPWTPGRLPRLRRC